ncbi:MAG: hypothetical protein HY646_22740 [Acidobacteria bacterium]|nr:hypothetical protein [Acidobacteriota bacterium]
MTLRFENGLLATGLYGCEATQKQIEFEVFLPDRSIRLCGWDLKSEKENEPAGEDIFVHETAAFLKAVESGDCSTILANVDSAMQTQRVVDALRRAVETNSEVTVSA